MGAAWVLDQYSPAARGLARIHIGVGIAQHPGGAEVQADDTRSVEQHPRRRLATIARTGEPLDHPIGMVWAQARGIQAHALLRKQLDHALMYFKQLLQRSLPLGGRWLIGNTYEPIAGLNKLAESLRYAREQAHIRDLQRRLK